MTEVSYFAHISVQYLAEYIKILYWQVTQCPPSPSLKPLQEKLPKLQPEKFFFDT